MNKLPPRNIHLPAEQQGMFQKFYVNRVDRSDRPGFKHYNCQYFVLDETHDPFARPALQAYAMACQATHPQLAEELFAQWGVPASLKEKCCGTPENCPASYSECPFLGDPPASLDKPAPHDPADWKILADDVDPVHLGMDGKKWAEAFCERNKASDFGSMVGWFANAIMAGFDEGRRRATAAKSVPDGDSIAGAVARGWCAPANAHKQVDEELTWAIVGEVQKVLVAGQETLETSASAPASKLNELSAVGLLQSLWNDTGLRQLMRPDQVRRLAHVLGKEQAQ